MEVISNKSASLMQERACKLHFHNLIQRKVASTIHFDLSKKINTRTELLFVVVSRGLRTEDSATVPFSAASGRLFVCLFFRDGKLRRAEQLGNRTASSAAWRTGRTAPFK